MISGIFSRAAVKLRTAALLVVGVTLGGTTLGPPFASAAPACGLDAVLGNLIGAQLLHQLNPQFHLSPSVSRTRKLLAQLGVKNVRNAEKKIAAWLAVLERAGSGISDRPQQLQRLKDFCRRQHVITPQGIPEGYFSLQQRIARERGMGNLALPPETRDLLMKTAITNQEESLDQWIDYLASSDATYPMWAKIWAFDGMTRIKKIDPTTGQIFRRSKDTVEPFVELNREALSLAIQDMTDYLEARTKNAELPKAQRPPYAFPYPEAKKLLPSGDFANLYGWYVHQLKNNQVNLEVTDGKWVKYPKGSDPTPLVKSLDCKNTGWCTAGRATAAQQLEGGDFYVYYSNDSLGRPKNPRIAIRMQDDQIAEVRGVGPGQEVDPQIAKTDVVSTKLNEFGEEGKKYEKKDRDMKRLTEIERKISAGHDSLSTEELRFLYEIDDPIQGFGYRKDPRIAQLLMTRDKRKDLARIYGIRADEVSFSRSEALSGKCKIHFGDLDLSDLRSGEGLQLPQTVRGALDLRNLTSAQGLQFPNTIQGDLNLRGLTSAQGLQLPQTIHGNLSLSSLPSAQGLQLPKTIRGTLDLSGLTSAQGLQLPQTIHGSLHLSSLTSAPGLKFPQTIHGNLSLSSLTSAQGLQLPETIHGSLHLGSLPSAQGLKLPQTIHGTLFLNNLSSAQGVQFPRTIQGDLRLNRLTSAQGLQLPNTIQGDLDLRGLTSAQGLQLPQTIHGSLFLHGLPSAEGLELTDGLQVGQIYLDGLKTGAGLRLPIRLKPKIVLPDPIHPEWIP